jgi:hypothetical protein
VTGSGSARTLSYGVRNASGRQIVFAERGRRTYRVLDPARSARGTIRFTPAPGTAGRREIVALLQRDGLTTRSLVVASYAVRAAGRPAKPTRLRLARRGSTVRVSWGRATGAARFAVLLELANGVRTLRVTPAHAIALSGVPATVGGAVSVVGIASDGTRGAAARTAFGPVHRAGRDRSMS